MGERDLTSGVITELSKSLVRPALFWEGIFDDGAVRLWSGIGNYTLFGNTFIGIGDLGGIDKVQESAGDVRATGIGFVISGIPSANISLLFNENFQGRPATVWLGFFNSAGALIADAVKLGVWRMDMPVLEEDGETARITVFAESRLVDLERARLRRFTDEDQRELYPSDTGLRFVVGLQNKEVSWKS